MKQISQCSVYDSPVGRQVSVHLRGGTMTFAPEELPTLLSELSAVWCRAVDPSPLPPRLRLSQETRHVTVTVPQPRTKPSINSLMELLK